MKLIKTIKNILFIILICNASHSYSYSCEVIAAIPIITGLGMTLASVVLNAEVFFHLRPTYEQEMIQDEMKNRFMSIKKNDTKDIPVDDLEKQISEQFDRAARKRAWFVGASGMLLVWSGIIILKTYCGS